MALVQGRWYLAVDLIDTGGNITTRKYDMVATDTAGDASAVFEDAATIIAALIAVTDAKIKNYQLGVRFAENALTLPAAAEVENNLQVSAKIVGNPNKTAVFEIPAPKDTLFLEPTGFGYNTPDFADSLLAAYVNLFNSTGVAYLSDGERITAQDIKGKRVHHKSTKG